MRRWHDDLAILNCNREIRQLGCRLNVGRRMCVERPIIGNCMNQLSAHLIGNSDEPSNIRDFETGVTSKGLNLLISGSTVNVDHIDNRPEFLLTFEFNLSAFDNAG